MACLAGAWVGTRGAEGTTSIEERWSPPLGGSMLAVSRTVSRGKKVAFEYLRLAERDGGLVYVAQPGGAAPTEFVLTEVNSTRAVFVNLRHDFPQRIVYELAAEGRGVSASIGHAKGGRPRRFEFQREGDQASIRRAAGEAAAASRPRRLRSTAHDGGRRSGSSRYDHSSKRSRFMTLVQAATKSLTNFVSAPAVA
jgi:hypothetical protein